ncbi:MAG: N-acetyl-alpha-D-muramate 1-phosphate uridylyltransferase [Thiomicrorhabdus sp.]|nr:MAG: N-acetyl-alpha-D-muramate 1-phosphate uridylyltransferase [Thiomicrorhabdus sp.]
MILAAGRGNRFRPLTDTLPKPLIPLCGKPLIEYHIEKLVLAGVTELVINHAWLGQQLEAVLGNGERWGIHIQYSAEPEGGLETAGGIIKALPLLGDQPFLVINGDVYCDVGFENLIDKAIQMAKSMAETEGQKSLAHLLLVPCADHAPSGDFGLNASAQVIPQGNYTFAGISVLSPQLFKGLSVDFIKLAPILRKAMQAQTVTGELFEGFWSDVGTYERLEATEKVLCS